MVDLLAEKGLLDYFADEVEERLAAFGTDIISDFVADLLRDAEAVVQQAKAPSAKGIRRAGSVGFLATTGSSCPGRAGWWWVASDMGLFYRAMCGVANGRGEFLPGGGASQTLIPDPQAPYRNAPGGT